MEVAYQLHLFAMGFRLDLALSNIYKGFRDRWRLKAKDEVFHITTERLILEGTSGLFSNALCRQGHVQHYSGSVST